MRDLTWPLLHARIAFINSFGSGGHEPSVFIPPPRMMFLRRGGNFFQDLDLSSFSSRYRKSSSCTRISMSASFEIATQLALSIGGCDKSPPSGVKAMW